MKKKIITLQVGEQPSMIGEAMWKMFLNADYMFEGQDMPAKNINECMMEETKVGLAPLSVNLFPDDITIHKTSNIAQIPISKHVTQYEHVKCCGIDFNQIRKIAERTSNLEGFIILNQIEDAFSSTLSTPLLQLLHEQFPKCIQFANTLFDSQDLTHSYNSLMGLSALNEYCTVCIMTNIDAIRNICRNKLSVLHPSIENIHELITYGIGIQTSNFRDSYNDFYDMNFLTSFLVPFPSLKYICHSYSPFISCDSYTHEIYTTSFVTLDAFSPQNNFTSVNYQNGVHTAFYLNYVGYIIPKDVGPPFSQIKTNQNIRWCKSINGGFKCSISYLHPQVAPGGLLSSISRTCNMFSNNTYMAQVIDSIVKKMDLSQLKADENLDTINNTFHNLMNSYKEVEKDYY